MTKPKPYQEQYCKKHDQYYGKHLTECPICAGERMYNPNCHIPKIKGEKSASTN